MGLVTVKLGTIASLDRRIVAPNTAEAEALPYLGLEQIEAQTGRILAYETASEEGKSTTFAFDARHVLYGKLRPYLNKVVLPDRKGRCTTEIIPLLAHNVARDYLAFRLRGADVVAAAMSDKTGSRMPRADMDALWKYEVRIPESIDDQRRIAALLKAQLAAVEQARRAAQAQAAEMDVVARRMQENVLAELDAVPRVRLGDILLGIETGKSFQTTDRLARDDELGVLKVSAVSWSEFKPREAKAVAARYMPEPHHRVREGDLLMSRANTMELAGAVVRVSKSFSNRLLSDKTLRLVLDESKACPGYVMQVLRMTEARTHIEANATGTSNSMRNISQDTIRATPIPLLPLIRQCAVAERLSASDAALRDARVAAQAQLADIEQLPARLLAQAFDHPDEGASP